jgi:Transcriptional regulator, AbiEi antitoxin
MRSTWDRSIANLAGRQHGVVSRRQLRGLGFSEDRIKGRIRRGQLHVVHRGVYAVGFRPTSGEARRMAAVLACGPGAVLSHRSAACHWGLRPAFGGSTEVTRTKGWRAPVGITVHRALLPTDERTVVDGIPVTTMPRTILDLAAVVSRRQLERTLNEVEVRGLTDRLSVPDLLARYPRRRGSAVLRVLLDDFPFRAGLLETTWRPTSRRFSTHADCHGRDSTRMSRRAAGSSRWTVSGRRSADSGARWTGRAWNQEGIRG